MFCPGPTNDPKNIGCLLDGDRPVIGWFSFLFLKDEEIVHEHRNSLQNDRNHYLCGTRCGDRKQRALVRLLHRAESRVQ